MYKMPEVTNYKKKDNTYCCVPLCKSRGSKNPDVSFHLFPSEKKELDRRKKWILALRIGKPVTSRMSVCSRHFVHSDYVLPPHYQRQRPRLQKHAIPTLNLPPSNAYDKKPDKRPMTIVIKKESMIKKECSSAESEGERSEENAEQEELEIEVNIKSERDYFGTDYYNFEYEQDYLETDNSIESEQNYFKTENGIDSKRDYLESEDSMEPQQDYLETDDDVKSKQDYSESEDSTESQGDYFEIDGNIKSKRDHVVINEIVENCVDMGNDIESDQDYLDIESKIKSDQKYLKVEENIKSMTLMTLSKILI